MIRTNLKKGAAAVCCAAVICAASFAAQTETGGTQKVGLVTGISYSVTDNKITVTAALGAMKEMPKPDKQEPPKQIKAEDLIALSGETVTFTLPADTALELGMPPKNDADGSDKLPPPPKDDKKPEMKQPPLTVKNILIADIVTLTYNADGKTVTGVTAAMLPVRGMMNGKDGKRMKRPMGKGGRNDAPANCPGDDQPEPEEAPQD
ncbi:MAG TPA: hypothetical protein DCL73_03630 [Treponema sp.]|nr:hypothetical protein [Treponema sp.]